MAGETGPQSPAQGKTAGEMTAEMLQKPQDRWALQDSGQTLRPGGEGVTLQDTQLCNRKEKTVSDSGKAPATANRNLHLERKTIKE